MGIAGSEHASSRNRIYRVQSASFKNSQIRFLNLFVISLKVFIIRVKTVKVFHHKFFSAQKARLGPRLISKLGLYLIRGKRKVFVGTDIFGRDGGKNLLMRPAKHEAGLLVFLSSRVKSDFQIPSRRRFQIFLLNQGG